MMQMLAQEYPITQISEVLEVARSTYYHRRAPSDEQEVRQAIEAVAAEYPRYGYRASRTNCGDRDKWSTTSGWNASCANMGSKFDAKPNGRGQPTVPMPFLAIRT